MVEFLWERTGMRYTDEHNYTEEDVQILTLVISGRIDERRRERMYYWLGFAILTPFAVAASLFVFLLCLANEIGRAKVSFADLPFPISAFLSLMWMLLLVNQMVRYKEHGANFSALGHSFWLIALQVLLALLPLQEFWPKIFWIVYGMLIVLILGIMGRGYDSRYNLQLSGDADRVQAEFAISVAIPAALICMYAKLQEQAWLKRGLDREELLAAALLLFASACRNTYREDSILRAIGRESAERVTDALLCLNLVERKSLHHILTTESELLLQNCGVSAWC